MRRLFFSRSFSSAARQTRVDGSGDASQRAAARYTFTTLLDSQRDGLEPTRCAAIDTLGTVAVTVQDTLTGVTRIITKRRASDLPVVVADTEPIADFPTFCDNGFSSLPSDPSINELGEVGFQGSPRRLTTRAECGVPAQRARRQGVFLGRGGPLTTIAHTINPPGGDFISEFLVADQSVNTFGKAALVPELDETFEQGLFVGSKNGTFQQRFISDRPTRDAFTFNNISSRVSMNKLSQIAFESGLADRPVSGIFLFQPRRHVQNHRRQQRRLRVGEDLLAERLRPRRVHRQPLRRGLQSDLSASTPSRAGR